jgi:hypothetical protein
MAAMASGLHEYAISASLKQEEGPEIQVVIRGTGGMRQFGPSGMVDGLEACGGWLYGQLPPKGMDLDWKLKGW